MNYILYHVVTMISSQSNKDDRYQKYYWHCSWWACNAKHKNMPINSSNQIVLGNKTRHISCYKNSQRLSIKSCQVLLGWKSVSPLSPLCIIGYWSTIHKIGTIWCFCCMTEQIEFTTVCILGYKNQVSKKKKEQLHFWKKFFHCVSKCPKSGIATVKDYSYIT